MGETHSHTLKVGMHLAHGFHLHVHISNPTQFDTMTEWWHSTHAKLLHVVPLIN